MGTLLELGLDNAFVALILAPVAAVLGRLGRRPALAHTLWLLVLLRLVAPPLLGAVSVPIPILRVSPTVDTPLPWWRSGPSRVSGTTSPQSSTDQVG